MTLAATSGAVSTSPIVVFLPSGVEPRGNTSYDPTRLCLNRARRALTAAGSPSVPHAARAHAARIGAYSRLRMAYRYRKREELPVTAREIICLPRGVHWGKRQFPWQSSFHSL